MKTNSQPARLARPTAHTTQHRTSPGAPPPKTAGGNGTKLGSGWNGFRRRHPVLSALVPAGLVVAAIAAMVVVKATSSPTGAAPAAATSGPQPLAAGVAAAVASVPPSTLDQIGSPPGVTPPASLGTGTSLLRGADGKPEILYVGAEYCPYCAAERWALAVALSRFGTFNNLSQTHSSSSDVFPDTQTLSFYGSSYSSQYLDFVPVEEATNTVVGGSYQPLQSATAAEQALMAEYDGQGSIPFIDIGNRFAIVGSSYSPQVLQGLTRAQIARQLSDPASPVARAIDGTANEITAAITSITGGQPASVANSSVITPIDKSPGA
jgi:hypothetical protein